ncbi:PREDICTED: uncharacterized protein LOC109582043 isoform X2 [Amphimedon queenslandica]|uniref:Uncharacterized protein n=1 Tax=Amphimedon queenslandica TaxID=400682 RepID=A0A1X7UVZ4_AMPQE|nr:PREDICTED: uncharacterized protein LOC109582043 isoform X2 [Amphimedon queenslandica]|eukprot:XP_019852166.1 PREDICTED: uncharacterized protein LOC109582043 isoform X2 [Amphimedon queenslandica]
MESEGHCTPDNNQQLCMNSGPTHFRRLRFITSDPSAFIFMLSLVVLACCCPLLVVYMDHSSELPDFDKMKTLNSFLGSLPRTEFCFYSNNETEINSAGNYSYMYSRTDNFGLFVTFLIHSDVPKGKLLTLDLTGKELHTKIVDQSQSRTDINLHVFSVFNTSKATNCSKNWCAIEACVVVAAPMGTKNLIDFEMFSKTCANCFCSQELDFIQKTEKNILKMSNESCATVVKPFPEKYRRHGLISIYLSQVDKEKAQNNIFKITLVFIALLIVFLIGMTCTQYKQPQMSHND